MCGITGKVYFDLHKQVEISEIKKMTSTLRHRGPDDEGYYIDSNVGFGFRRLSIIDLSTGHQPLCDNSGRYYIIFNGEIYNFKEQREILQKKGYHFRTNSDTEVIVNLYAEYKEKCVSYLRGMFAFVIWDNKEKELFGARDRFGIKPFFYYIDDEKFVWGSEIKSILAASQVKTYINNKELEQYLAYGYSSNHQTIYSQIKKLDAATFFTLKTVPNKSFKIESYWNLVYAPDYGKSENYWKERVFDTLVETVKLHMVSDVPVGAFLSGGIDSSIAVALMSLNSSKPIKTFSIGFKDEEFNELPYSRLVAERYGTEHHELIVEPESIDLLSKLVSAFDEPFADSSAIPTYYVSKFASDYVKVSLSGDGGDELFVGYNHYDKNLKIYNNFLNNRISYFIFKKLNSLVSRFLSLESITFYMSKKRAEISAYLGLWRDYERERLMNPQFKNQLNKNVAEQNKIDFLKNLEGDELSKMQLLDIQYLLVDDFLTKVDISSMSNSLEIRVPFLDHKLAELAFEIPSELKYKNKIKKYVLKKTFSDLLPPEIISHKKQGFGVPLNYWFRKDLKDFTYDTLMNNSNLNEFLNTKYINLILDDHQKGIRNYSSKIWSLLVLNEWLEQNKNICLIQ